MVETVEQISDSSLWRRFCAGDQAAIAELLELHGGRLRAIAWRVCGNETDADDAVQILVERMLQMTDAQKAAVRDVRAWMSGAVINCSRNFIDKEVRLHQRHQRAQDESGMQGIYSFDDGSVDEEQQHLLAAVDETLRELPEKYQDPLILHYLHGMQFKDVGEALGRSEEAVKKQAQRAIGKLKELLEKRGVAVAGLMLMPLVEQLHAVEVPLSAANKQLIQQLADCNFAVPAVTAAAPVLTQSLMVKALSILLPIVFISGLVIWWQSPDSSAVPLDNHQQSEPEQVVLPAKEPYADWDRVALASLIRQGAVTQQVNGEDYTLTLNSRDIREPAKLRINDIIPDNIDVKLHFYMRVKQRHKQQTYVCCGNLVQMPGDIPLYSPDAVAADTMARLEGWHDVVVSVRNSVDENGKAALIRSVDGEVRDQVQFEPVNNDVVLAPICIHSVDVEIRDLRILKYSNDL